MKTCYFQGTFNPPHNGHLLIAEFVLKNTDYEKVVFVPAYKPPHKSLNEENPLHRLNMTKILVENENGLDVSDIEFQREEPSYTFVTVKNLVENSKTKENGALTPDTVKEYENGELVRIVTGFDENGDGQLTGNEIDTDLTAGNWRIKQNGALTPDVVKEYENGKLVKERTGFDENENGWLDDINEQS